MDCPNPGIIHTDQPIHHIDIIKLDTILMHDLLQYVSMFTLRRMCFVILRKSYFLVLASQLVATVLKGWQICMIRQMDGGAGSVQETLLNSDAVTLPVRIRNHSGVFACSLVFDSTACT